MKLALVGPGAFGEKHLAALAAISDANVVSIVGPDQARTKRLAATYDIASIDRDLDSALARPDIDGFILATPTPLHASQAKQCLRAGKHVAVEIPAAENLQDVLELVDLQKQTGLVCMVGHTRRYNPSHQWIKYQIERGDFSIQHMDVQTFFFRRTNTNALGEARDWTDHLLWHHAAHTIDLFLFQTGETIVCANILQGHSHPDLGIAMDMSIQLQSNTGILLTLALSFNNDGPLGSQFRYIGDSGTYIARYDDLFTGHGDAIDLSHVAASQNGIELQNRDFIDAIQFNTEPRASIARVLPCYLTIHALSEQLSRSIG